jgi:outer membrane protein assembly factor BamB
MATLEIHDDRGHVQRVLISREYPALLGSSPDCDIVLHGNGILPVHGRIRWKGRRFKVDASPQARAIERNGKKVATAAFRIGDEVRIGAFRIFMINPDSGPLDDKTRLAAPQEARASGPLSRTFEKLGWLRGLEVAPPSVEMPGESGSSPIDASYDRALKAAVARREAKEQAKKSQAGGPWGRRLVSMLAARDERPGHERILTSPLVLGLAASLVVLVMLGFWIHGVISRTVAQRQFDRAMQSHEEGQYPNAIVQFNDFMKTNPKDKRFGKALVMRHLSNVEQYARGGTPSWTNALQAALSMVSETSKRPEFEDESIDLAELVLKTAEGLADRTRAESDPKEMAKSLKEAEAAVALHTQLAGKAAAGLMGRSKVPGKLEQARAAVRKSETRTAALTAMQAALDKKSAAGVYAARDRLVSEYSDLAKDRALVGHLTRANELLRAAVRFDPSRRPAETVPNPEPLSPPTSLVLRSSPGQPPADASGPVVYALAEGFAYGVDGTNGAPLWHIPIGISAPFPPVAIAGGDAAALVFDNRHNELCRINGRTGALVWRQGLEEPIIAPPLVLGNQAIQATPGGKLMFLDLATGELTGTLHVGRRLGQPPVSDEAGGYLYVMADEANLFLIKRDPLACTAVEYTGHAPGSLLCPPARLSKYLIVAENYTLADGRWTVYELLDEGAKVRPVQQVDVPGWTWSTPTAQGSIVWAAGDRGGPIAFAMGEQKVPLQVVAKLGPDNRASGPAFARARTERELWIASSRSGRFDLNAERASIATAWTLTEAGPALAPIQVAGRLIVLTQQPPGQLGTALWGVDPNDGSVRWRTILGSPWPLALAGSADGSALTTVATDGSPFSIDRDRLLKGGFVEEPLPKPGVFSLPPGPLERIEAENAMVVIPAPDASQLLVREGQSELHTVNLPASLGALPVLWGSNLLVPCADGRVYLIDPKSGASRAEPLVPSYDRDHPIYWRAPARIDADAVVLADEVGSVRRVTLTEGPRPKLVVKAQVDLGAKIEGDPVATESAIVLVTSDGRVRALAARDLSPQGAWALDAPRALGPVMSGGYTFVADTAGKLFAFGPDGQRRWSVELEGALPSGPPLIQANEALFLNRDGTLDRRSLADGKLMGRHETGIVHSGGLSSVGTDVVVPVAPGTVRLLLQKIETAQ